MKKSALKDQIEELNVKYYRDSLSLQQSHYRAKQDLIKGCLHIYDDGTSAKIRRGIVDDFGYDCAICGEDLK